MASRKDEKEQRRQERLAREASEQQQAQRRRTYGIVVGVILVLAVIGVVVALLAGGGSDTKSSAEGKPSVEFANATKPPAQATTDLFAAAKKADCELKNPAIAGREHVDSDKEIDYKTDPPTSGNHDQIPQPDGVYTTYPQPRHAVHALEGGRVQIQYNPAKVSKKEIATLGGVFNEDTLYMLMYPNPKMDYAVAVSAWGHLAGCKKVNAATYDVIRAFIDRYRDQSPEPAAQHQVTAGQPGWPGPTPPPHKDGSTPGS